jgi:hypothetical protein
MNRCARAAASSAVAIACLLGAGAVLAQTLQRPFPANAWRGELVVGQPPAATLNGQAVRLAPGARIRNLDNLLVLSGTLIGQRLLVHYTLDGEGLVQDAWILSPSEAAKLPWPRNAQEAQGLRFDPAAQAWSRP